MAKQLITEETLPTNQLIDMLNEEGLIKVAGKLKISKSTLDLLCRRGGVGIRWTQIRGSEDK